MFGIRDPTVIILQTFLTGASVPAAKGLNPWGDVILAYEMNGQVYIDRVRLKTHKSK